MAVECGFNIGNVLVSLASVGFGGIVGFLSARHISTQNIRAAACAKLRAAFAPALANIYVARHQEGTVDKKIKDALLDHAAAVEEFRPFVRARDSTAYQKAWEQYRQSAAQCQYSRVGEASDLGLEEDELLEKQIHAVLHFATT